MNGDALRFLSSLPDPLNDIHATQTKKVHKFMHLIFATQTIHKISTQTVPWPFSVGTTSNSKFLYFGFLIKTVVPKKSAQLQRSETKIQSFPTIEKYLVDFPKS